MLYGLIDSDKKEVSMSQQRKYPVHLTPQGRKTLEQFVRSGQKNAREITRARILLLADEGKSDWDIVSLLNVSRPTIHATRQRYYDRSAGKSIIERLKDAPRSGRAIKLDSRVEAKVAMIACSDPPEGSARWTLTMIADRLVKLEVIDSICQESVRSLLKKTN